MSLHEATWPPDLQASVLTLTDKQNLIKALVQGKQFDTKAESFEVTEDVFIALNMAKIRYGRIDGKHKNTLYTIAWGDYITFGISRCNFTMADRFSKKEGRSIARERAVKAHESYHERKEMMIFAEDGLSGQVRADLINVVLDYFYNIEEDETPQEARQKENMLPIEEEVAEIMADVKASVARLDPVFSALRQIEFQISG